MFGLIVASYVTAVIGIPVYLHYCGGELENVSYVIKKVTCCGEEEESESMDDGCCKDHNLVLRNAPDFTLKQISGNDFVKAFCDLFYTPVPFTKIFIQHEPLLVLFSNEFPPPKLQNSLVISTSVIRV